MHVLAGLVFAAAALAVVAGSIKLARPAATTAALRQAKLPSARPLVRLLGAVEIAAGLAAVGFGTAPALGALALLYAGFGGFAALAAGRRPGSCGCFGSASAAVGPVHVIVNLAVALTVGAAALSPPGSLVDVVASQPDAGIPFLALTGLVAALLYLTYTAFADLTAELDRSARR